MLLFVPFEYSSRRPLNLNHAPKAKVMDVLSHYFLEAFCCMISFITHQTALYYSQYQQGSAITKCNVKSDLGAYLQETTCYAERCHALNNDGALTVCIDGFWCPLLMLVQVRSSTLTNVSLLR